MDNLFHNGSRGHSEHPSREVLLLMVDGELQAKEAAQLEGHLEACWPCRVKTQKIQDAIANIIEFDDQVLTPRLTPPQDWRNFDRKLSQVVITSGKQSLSSRLFGSFGRFLPSSQRFATPQILSPAFVRTALAIVVVVVVVTLVLRLTHVPTVSASQLLNKSIEAETLRARSLPDAVVHQTLRITMKDQASEHAVDVDIWREANNARVRQFIAGVDQLVPIAPDISTQNQISKSDRDLIGDLQTVLRANHMDVARPLSAASYQSWHSTLNGERDEISRSKDKFGIDAISLHTVVADPLGRGQISEATFVVRAGDWLPTELQFTVNAHGGSRRFQLTQTRSEVVSLFQVSPKIFSDRSDPIVLSKNDERKNEAQATSSPALAMNSQPMTSNTATADLEVEALRLLHGVSADLGEQIGVQKNAAGQLEIVGIVETDQRKREIINALAPLAGNPAVRIEVQTVAEAVAQQQQQRLRSKATPAPVTEEDIQINSETIAAATELRRHFNSDEQMRQYAARIVRQSRGAMSHAYAMKRLMAQFTPESLRTLTPEAKSKWLDLIRAHARAYQNSVQAMRRELQPIFSSGASGSDASSTSAITDDAALARAVEGLFRAASATDQTIHAAFAASSERVAMPAISSHFWQQMSTAEAIAARIAQAR